MHHRNLSPRPFDTTGPKSVVWGVVRYLLRPMATLPPDLVLHQLGRKDRTAADQLKLFHLALVVLDPYTYESSWLLETGARIQVPLFVDIGDAVRVDTRSGEYMSRA